MIDARIPEILVRRGRGPGTIREVVNRQRNAVLSLVVSDCVGGNRPVNSGALTNLLPCGVSDTAVEGRVTQLTRLNFLGRVRADNNEVPDGTSCECCISGLVVPGPLATFRGRTTTRELSIGTDSPRELLGSTISLLRRRARYATFCSTVRSSLSYVRNISVVPTKGKGTVVIVLSMNKGVGSSIYGVSYPISSSFGTLFCCAVHRCFVNIPLSRVGPTLLRGAIALLNAELFSVLPTLADLYTLYTRTTRNTICFNKRAGLLGRRRLKGRICEVLSFLTSERGTTTAFRGCPTGRGKLDLFVKHRGLRPLLGGATAILAEINCGGNRSTLVNVVNSAEVSCTSVLPETRCVVGAIGGCLREKNIRFRWREGEDGEKGETTKGNQGGHGDF